MKRPWEGHRLGLEKAREALRWACDYGINYITAYVLSLENLALRPKRELAFILRYLGMEADAIMQDTGHIVHRYRVKVNFIGQTQRLPAWLRSKIRRVEKTTAKYKDHVLNVALAYGGQQEIADAVREIAKKVMKGIISPAVIDEKIVKEHLYTNGQPMPDLIIRTGGERRLSNFLTFQSAYSELVFIDKRWPEITRRDFLAALREFEKRQRKFGR